MLDAKVISNNLSEKIEGKKLVDSIIKRRIREK